MDELRKKVANLSPAKRALLEQRLQGEVRKPAGKPLMVPKVWQATAPIAFSSEGKGTPLVLFHYLSSSQLLSKYLGADRPIYAVDGGFDEELHHWEATGQMTTCLQALAERCVKQLKIVQPTGPYMLGGFCFGGVLAFEAANQLNRAGDKVIFLGMIDAFYTFEIDTAAMPEFIEKGIDEQGADGATVEKTRKSRIAFMGELSKVYQSSAYPGSAVLFRAMAGRDASDRAANGWEKVVTGGLQLEDCQTTRAKFFEQPHVAELAGKLGRHISAMDPLESREVRPEPKAVSAEKVKPEFIAPRTYTEQVLYHIWREWLNLPGVGVRDNFFDLGGDSLLAIRVIEQINRTLKVHLHIPAMFQSPTIEKLAGVLDQKHHVKPEPQLVTLQAGVSPGSLFLLEAGMGLGLCRMVETFDTGPATYATVAPLSSAACEAAFLGRQAELPTLEEIAAPHTALIRSRYTEPCWLAGHCFGAILAFAVAHQLEREGKKVEMIFVMDAWAKSPITLVPPWSERLKGMTFGRATRSIKTKATRLWREIIGATAQQPANPGIIPQMPIMTTDSVNPLDPEIIGHIFLNAHKNYPMRPLQSRALLLRPNEVIGDMAPYYALDGTLGWKGLFTGGLEIIECPGNHQSMLKAPHLQFLTRQLQAKLEHVRRPDQPRSVVTRRNEKPPATFARQ